MKDSIIKYSSPVMTLFICVFILFKSCNDDENTEKNFRRDILVERKIDSLNAKITGLDEKLLLIDLSIAGSNEKITFNKIKYDNKKKDISAKPADTVYNWTKQQLRKRTK